MLNKGSCEARLSKARHVLEVITHRPDIAHLFNLTQDQADVLTLGWSLYHQARTTTTHRLNQKGDAAQAQTRCTQTFRAAQAAQGRLTALARLMITAPADRDRLGLAGRRADAVGAWRCQAELFHANLTQADRAQLTQVGVHLAELNRAAELLVQLAQDHAACIAAKARARAATSAKAAAFAALATWLSRLIGMARVLEPDHPDLVATLKMKPDARRRPTSAARSVDQETTMAPPPDTRSATDEALRESEHPMNTGEDLNPSRATTATSSRPAPEAKAMGRKATSSNAGSKPQGTGSHRSKGKASNRRKRRKRAG